MSLNVVVSAGYTFPPGIPVTLAALRRAALPTVSISGSVATGDLINGAVTALKVTPDAFWYELDTGVANAAVLTLNPAATALADGLEAVFKVAFANTKAVTLNVNNLGAVPVKKNFNLDLEPGDWRQGQIVVVRYQLDANSVPTAAAYDGAGAYSLPVVVGRVYTWTKNGSDTNCVVDGATTLVATGTFTATASTVTLHGTISAAITATVAPVSNFWQMLTPTANLNRVNPLVGATGLTQGISGLAPGAKVGEQTFGLRGDGRYFDFLTAAAALANPGGAALEIFKQQNFI